MAAAGGVNTRFHFEAVMPERLSYSESCKILQDQHILVLGAPPALPERPPRHDDENLGVSFFRTQLADAKLDNLTLPRTFIARSEIRGVSFCGTDLSESTANWNDFIDVDFTSADLSRADLRASTFEHVNFRRAILRGADLRRTAFQNCTFADAELTGAKLNRACSWFFRLSRAQRAAVDWQADSGPEPEGG
jgi:uncharacterized protein YjbI with pentapeptide repeats